MNKRINRFFSRPVFVASELFSSGWCNLACKYCYIPKTDFLKEVHQDIIKKIQDDTYINILIDMFGEDLESISHWGTEPTLTVKLFKQFYEKAETVFPKLKGIKLSSNFMTPPENLFTFVTEVLSSNKEYDIDIQVSCDGPEFITDKNRIGGSTSKIINNCLELTRMLNESNFKHKVTMHLKPTFGADDIFLCSNYDKMKEYYLFFEDFMKKWIEANKNKKILISRVVNPTIAMPGTYCVQDGKNFYNLNMNQQKLKKELKWEYIASPESSYFSRFKNKSNFFKEYFTKQRMFTCSAGDTCMGLGDIIGNVHMCHATFYIDHPEYFVAAKEYNLDPQTMEGIESGRVDQLKDKYIFNIEDDYAVTKCLYKTRLYNDFSANKLSSAVALALELAACKQINPIYNNMEMAKMLAVVTQTTECPVNVLTITGSISSSTASILRLFGNGAFEEILKSVLKEI
jgi:hypothetical protein